MNSKSKSAMSFKEFEKMYNKSNDFEHDWGHFIDTENTTWDFEKHIHKTENEYNDDDNDDDDDDGDSFTVKIVNVVFDYGLKILFTANLLYLLFKYK